MSILTPILSLSAAFFTSRAFKFSARKGPGGVSAGASVGHNTTQAGDEAEMSIAVRLFGARDIALGLLLRDSTAAVVTRALQVSFRRLGVAFRARSLMFAHFSRLVLSRMLLTSWPLVWASSRATSRPRLPQPLLVSPV